MAACSLEAVRCSENCRSIQGMALTLPTPSTTICSFPVSHPPCQNNLMKPFLCLLLLAWAIPVFSAPPAVVSSGAQSSVSAAGNSFNPTFSADGQHLVFVSHANNLVTNDDLGPWLDVFVRDLVSSNTVLVSVGTNGFGGANEDANFPSISSNGQFIAFASRANNLAPGDTNGGSDVFVRDMNTGLTRLVSVDLNGNPPADPSPTLNTLLSSYPLISGDGRWVFFESRATNLVAAGAPLGSVNIYARDTWSNVTVLVTADTNGNPVLGRCNMAGITPDARWAAFTTTDTSLVPGINSSRGDVYVRDRQTGTTFWASTNTAALLGGNYTCSFPALAENGAGLAFLATATAGGATYLLFFDLASRVRQQFFTFPISNAPPVISADGSVVAFEASSNGWTQILLWNRASNAVSVAHQKLFGNYPGSPSHVDALSANARYLVFRELGVDSAYFTNSPVSRYHLFRKDLVTSTLELLSANTNQAAGAGDFLFSAVAVTPDAGRVAFDSTANDLAPGDLNGASDIFLHDVNAGVTELITKAQPTKPASASFAHSLLGLNSVSADGRFIVSTRYDDPSAYRDTNGFIDVFVSDVITGASVAASINQTVYFTNSGGGSGDTVSVIVNTNSFTSPVISADGSTIYATRGYTAGPTHVYGVWTSNAWNGTGMGLASRGINVSENGSSYAPSVSSNGQFLVFTTTSSDMVSGVTDNNLATDIILRRTVPLSIGSNQLISVALSGTAGNGASSSGLVSPDGRWVIFESLATDLVTNNTGGYSALFARDVVLNTTHLLNIPVPPYISYEVSPTTGSARYSADSRHVTFSTSLYGLIMVHDLFAGTNVIISDCCASLSSPALSADGRLVAYHVRTSGSSNEELRVRDLQSGQTDSIAAPGSFPSPSLTFSGDGRYLVFASKANGLVPNDTNSLNDIFVRDRLLGVTMLVSANAQGRAGNGPSARPVLAADGRTVVFQSFASDLVTGDYNDKRDVFVLKLGGADLDHDGMDDDWEMAYFNTTARDGTGDFDSDGVSDKAEFLAGTDPTNANSVFRVLTLQQSGGGARLLLWSGNPARSYRVEFKDDLGAVGWTALSGTISWNGSTASILDPSASSATNRYYRVLRLP